MNSTPPGWRHVLLGDVLERVEAGRSFAGEPRPAAGDEWGIIKVSAMTYGAFRERENKAVPDGVQFSKDAEIRPGDLLISRANTREYVGASVLVGECRPRLLLSDKSLRLHPRDLVDRRWLWHALNAPRTRRYLSEVSTGVKSGMRNVSQASLKSVPLSLPPPDEQRRIVELLEDHLSRLDAASTYLAACERRADSLHQAVLQTAMRGQLTTRSVDSHTRSSQLALRSALCPEGMKRGRPQPVRAVPGEDDWPLHWVRVSLEEATHPVRTISYGILKPGPNVEAGIPYVRVVNIRDDVLALDDLHRTTQEIAAQYDRSTLMPGDVLVSIRGTCGRVVIVPAALRGGNITQDTARLAFVGPVDPEFATVYLRSPWAQNFLKRVARGVAVKGVNIGDIRTMPFPIPPMTEQRAIIQRVAELTSEVAGARRTARSAVVRSSALRRALLEAAFAGKLTGRASELDRVEEMAGV